MNEMVRIFLIIVIFMESISLASGKEMEGAKADFTW